MALMGVIGLDDGLACVEYFGGTYQQWG